MAASTDTSVSRDLHGRVVLVTGAGGGLGSAVALAASRHGATLALTDIDTAGLAATMERVKDAHGAAKAAVADVTDGAAVRAMVAELGRELGSIDVLVNCAGITRIERRDSHLSAEEFRAVIDVNLNGTWNCTINVLPGMMARQSGAVVNVSSTATSLLMIGSSVAYCASKGAVEFVTKALARRLAPHIRVNAVAPGSIATPWYKKDYPDESTWPKRYVPMDDVVAVMLDLMTNTSMTGQVVTVDAGERFEVA